MNTDHFSITVEQGYTVQEILDRIVFYHDDYRNAPLKESYRLFPRILPTKKKNSFPQYHEIQITLSPSPHNPFALALETILQGDPEALVPPSQDWSVLDHCERLLERYCFEDHDSRRELRGRIVNIFAWDAHEPAVLYQEQILEFFLKNLEFLTFQKTYQRPTRQSA